jgi:predicted NUDIX family NTP pyrophosphohydrolase
MVRKESAGVLLYRFAAGSLEVLLVHPGGPFWAKKDDGAWSIPKGEIASGEDPWTTAKRELAEETGMVLETEGIALEPVRQPGGKVVFAWAIEHDFDPTTLASNTFSLEWPPRSGRLRQFPEVDRAAWFPPAEARRKILKGQVPFLDQLQQEISRQG